MWSPVTVDYFYVFTLKKIIFGVARAMLALNFSSEKSVLLPSRKTSQ